MSKSSIVSIFSILLLIGLAVYLSVGPSSKRDNQEVNQNNVSIVDGIQIIEIKAKGGYLPRVSVAQANMPTILRFDTTGTFDCSSVVRIPTMDIDKTLPLTGITDIDLGIQEIATLQGTCGMGMYPFEIEFKS